MVHTDAVGDDYASLGLSLDAVLSNDGSLGVEYRATLSSDRQDHAIGLKVGARFQDGNGHLASISASFIVGSNRC